MMETARSEESDRERSDQGDGLKRAPNVSSFTSCNTDKSADYAASCEGKQPLRVDPINELRKVEDDMERASTRRNLNIQSAMAAQDVFLRAGYDMRPYYGWLPGIAAPDFRIPAYIYPQTFFGFAPQNVAKKEQSNGLNRDANDAKCEENKDESARQLVRGNIERGPTLHGHKAFLAHNEDVVYGKLINNNNDALQHDAKSDVDEGLELDEYDSKNMTKILNMRRRSPESGELSPTRVAATTVSVIQQNCTAHIFNTKDARDADVADDDSDTEEAKKRLTKRGRASTRRIEKTEQYWDRRKKNNVSAKKSRDARRQREIVTNQRSALLEAENLRLRAEVATLKDENERLKRELSKVTSAV